MSIALNPAYFQYIDLRSLDYLNTHGSAPFIEVSRRDVSLLWSKYYKWPGFVCALPIEYGWARCQAVNNNVPTLIHLDIISESVGPNDHVRAPSAWSRQLLLFGDASPGERGILPTLENGPTIRGSRCTRPGTRRATQQLLVPDRNLPAAHPRPALNGEPYYSGYTDARSLGGWPGATNTAPREALSWTISTCGRP